MQKVSKPAQIDLMLDVHCATHVVLMLHIVQTWDDGMEHDRTGKPYALVLPLPGSIKILSSVECFCCV